MNIFNRIIMIILLLCLIVSSVVIAVNIFADLFSWSGVFERILNSIEGANPYVVLTIFIGITVIGIIILVFEFYRRRVKTTNVVAGKEGRARSLSDNNQLRSVRTSIFTNFIHFLLIILKYFYFLF